MKAARISFMQMMLFIRRDMMLFASCAAPLLAGVFFRFAVPVMERALVSWTGRTEVFAPYYGLIDLIFSMLAPIMFCFVTAMVVLEEHDDHIENYLFITTLGRKGYLISRIFLPVVIAFIMTVILLPVFKLTALSAVEVLFLSGTGALQGIIIALLIVTLSTNKLEGMAVTKMSTLTILGAFAPYFVRGRISYILSFLPSFWIGKTIYDHKFIFMIPAILAAFLWIYILMKKFLRKLS